MFARIAQVAFIAAIVAGGVSAHAQTWPTKPIKWLIGYPPGGGTDTMARIMVEPMSRALGQPIVIDNKPGANTMIAAEMLARSAPDGYTIMVADNGTLVNNAALYKKLSYDPVADLAPVSIVGRFQMVLIASPVTGFKSFDDLKRKVAAAPNKYRYASAGPGSPFHVGMESLKQEAGLAIDHIPYKGTAPAVQDVLSGQVELMIAPLAIVIQHIRSGKLLALASANAKRLSQIPEVPTLIEQGIAGGDYSGWQAIVVPANTPEEIKLKLHGAIKEALATSSVQQKFSELAIELVGTTPAEMRTYQASEIRRWHKFIKDGGITME